MKTEGHCVFAQEYLRCFFCSDKTSIPILSIIFFNRFSITPQAHYTALHFVAGRKDPPDLDLVQMILSAGADVHAKCLYQTTALHEAVERGHIQVSYKKTIQLH